MRVVQLRRNVAAAMDRRRWWYLGTGAGVVIVALAATWLFWPSPDQPSPPRARQYRDYTSCLLTTERGLNDPAAAPVWAGMQDASLTTSTRVQYLRITGPQTVDNGVTFVNTLTQTRCNLIIAAGDLPAASADRAASTFPTRVFYVSGTRADLSHVKRIDATTAAEIRSAVSHLIATAVP